MQDWSQVLSSSFPVPGNTGAIQVTCLHTLHSSGDPSSQEKWLKDHMPLKPLNF